MPTNPALAYLSPTQPYIKRSQRLEDALAALQSDSGKISSWGELGTKLLADALLERGRTVNDRNLKAVAAAEAAKRAEALKGLVSTFAPSPPPTAPGPQVGASPSPAPPAPAAMAQTPPAASSPTPTPTPAPAPAPAAAPPTVGGPLWDAMVSKESNGNQSAVSPKGAFGKAQLMPGTAQDMANLLGDPSLAEKARTDPQVNERLGQTYFEQMRQRFGSDAEALAAYNAGPSRVERWNAKFGDPSSGAISPEDWAKAIPFAETRDYVQHLLPVANAPAPQAGAPPPVQLAMNGPPTGLLPQSPAAAPPQAAGGPAPTVTAPQAAVGATPRPQITDQQKAILGYYLNDPDPAMQQTGMEYAMQLFQDAAKPVQFQSQTVNGVPTRFNPQTGTYEAVPLQGVQSQQHVSDGTDGMTAGTVYTRDPNGNVNVLQRPPEGYQGQPGHLSYQQGGPQDPTTGKNLIEGERQLRDEYSKATSLYQTARAGYEKVQKAATDQTGASDIALIFGFMKTLDPNSTVREGEFATAQNSGSVDQTVLNMYNRALHGERLQPDQRRQFAQTARGQYQVYEQQARRANDYYGKLAGQYGYDPSRIVRDIAPLPDLPDAGGPASSGPAGTRDAAIAEARRRGLIK